MLQQNGHIMYLIEKSHFSVTFDFPGTPFFGMVFFMLKIAAIFMGGGLGAICRYAIFLLFQPASMRSFPSGTLAANLIGSLCIGFLWYGFDNSRLLHEWRLFIFTGFLGGFTTFSTFTRETMQLFKTGAWKTALVYVSVSNSLGIALVFVGYFLAKRIIPLPE